MRILLIEDEDPKRNNISEFVSNAYQPHQLEFARSVRTAIFSIEEEIFDIVLLDMSLPTFDVDSTEPGGRPQPFGGIEVMRHMELYGLTIPTIVITAYEAFVKSGRKVDLEALAEELRAEHTNVFHGLVYYNSVTGAWKEQLQGYIDFAIDSKEAR
jgi:CheY-like chemotaxis protein